MTYGRYGSPPMLAWHHVILILVVVACVAYLILRLTDESKLRSAPAQRVHVKVVELLNEKTGKGGHSRSMTVELSDGSKRGFPRVNYEVFQAINQNDTGILIYQERKGILSAGTLVIGFEKN